MPAFQTAPAAGRRGVLSDENRMVTVGSLFSIVGWISRGKALFDKISSVLFNYVNSLVLKVAQFFPPKVKPLPEGRTSQLVKQGVQVLHSKKLTSGYR